VEARFGPVGDSANLDVRWVHGLRRTYYRLRNYFDTPDRTPSDVGHVESHFFPFEDTVSVSPR
jgi:hypothetical protein